MSFQQDDDRGLAFFINQRRNYAPTDFDRTLNFVQSYVYQLPFGAGKKWLTTGPASAVLGGWQLSGILSIYTGTPFYVTANGGSASSQRTGLGLNSPGSTQTANQIAPRFSTGREANVLMWSGISSSTTVFELAFLLGAAPLRCTSQDLVCSALAQIGDHSLLRPGAISRSSRSSSAECDSEQTTRSPDVIVTRDWLYTEMAGS
jgi:hypothetical protein